MTGWSDGELAPCTVEPPSNLFSLQLSNLVEILFILIGVANASYYLMSNISSHSLDNVKYY